MSSALLYDPLCVRKKSNWGLPSKKEYSFDHPAFYSEKMQKNIPIVSPKLDILLKKLEDLDASDMTTYGRYFKHFIFTDLTDGGAGIKMIASGMLSTGKYHMGYDAKLTKLGNQMKQNFDSIKNMDSMGSKGSDLSSSRSTKSSSSSSSSNNDSIEQEEQEEENYYSTSQRGGQCGGKKDELYAPINLLSTQELNQHEYFNIMVLCTGAIFGRPLSVKNKKTILSSYNRRPDNVFGQQIRFILSDSGYKEGVDMFDVKYVHIFEPPIYPSDQKQIIGRATRTCGQQGLKFHPTRGWPLHVFIYDLEFPKSMRSSFLGADTTIHLYLKSLGLNMSQTVVTEAIETHAIYGSVDSKLNYEVHKKYHDSHSEAVKSVHPSAEFRRQLDKITETYASCAWPPVKMENLCKQGSEHESPDYDVLTPSLTPSLSLVKSPSPYLTPILSQKGGNGNRQPLLQWTPTQQFLQSYFGPQTTRYCSGIKGTEQLKGMLWEHSVGTGKTCSAISTVSAAFEQQGYTILWVTRTTLKSDIVKNIFPSSCHQSVRQRLSNESLPDDDKARYKWLSPSWKIKPMSYKQFSNLVSQKNAFYKRLVKINGKEDPLRKTIIVIDEAHKLYGGADLSSIERPDMDAFYKSVQHSYTKSGDDSVRLILMTATPITQLFTEYIKLINLCVLKNDALPELADDFIAQYLDPDTYQFTASGSARFLDKINGIVSYLNREHDARQFSQPIITKIHIPITKNVTADTSVADLTFVKRELEGRKSEIKAQIISLQKQIEGETLNDLVAARFHPLISKCDQYTNKKIQKKCATTARKQIRNLVRDAKQKASELKGKITELKTQIGTIQDELKNVKKLASENGESISMALKRSIHQHHILVASCSYRPKTYADVTKIADQDIRITTILNRIKECEDEIFRIIDKIKVLRQHLSRDIKLVRKLSSTDENMEEANKLKNNTILELRRNFDCHNGVLANQKALHKGTIKSLRGEQRKTYRIIHKEIKKQTKENAKQMKVTQRNRKSEIALLRKAKTSSESYSEYLTELMTKYEKKISEDVEQVMNELDKKEREAAAKKLAKQQAKKK